MAQCTQLYYIKKIFYSSTFPLLGLNRKILKHYAKSAVQCLHSTAKGRDEAGRTCYHFVLMTVVVLYREKHERKMNNQELHFSATSRSV